MGANISSPEEKFRVAEIPTKKQWKTRFDANVTPPRTEKSGVSDIPTKKQWKPRFDANITPPSTEKSRVSDIPTKKQWRARFDAIKETDKLFVIDFTATWCGPCKSLEPKMKEFAAKYTDVEFVKVDVDVLMDVAMEFKVGALPAIVFVKRGKEVDRVVGVKVDELQKKIDKFRK